MRDYQGRPEDHSKNGQRHGFVLLFHHCSDGFTKMLGSKTLETKCIRISMCNVLANHDQNLESKYRLLKVYLFIKLESSNCRIYMSKSARLNRSKIKLNRSNLMQIIFLQNFSTQPKPIWRVGFYVLLKV